MSKRVNYRFPDDVCERLRVEAEESKVSVTDVILLAIEEYFNRKKPEPAEVKPVVVREFVNKSVEYKVSSGGYFRPMPKSAQTKNNGKEKK